MQRIPRDQARKYAFDWRDEPLLRVQPGETFEIETCDASTGYFKTPEDKAIPAQRPGFDRIPPLANPIGGPVCVEGAERGDTLVVTIEEIVVDDYSWIAIGPRRGPLGESTRWPELSSDYTTKIFRHTPGPSGTTRDGTLHFNDRISWPITPFIGTLGVAPDREVTTSLDGQGEWGGNLDIRDVAPGNRILPAGLPRRGAVLPRRRPRQPGRHRVHRHRRRDEGDGAAAARPDQGQARSPGCGSRSRSRSSRSTPYRPLEVAVETATINLMDWLITRLRLHADRRLLPGQHLPRLPHQRLSDVQARQAQLRGRAPRSQSATCPASPREPEPGRRLASPQGGRAAPPGPRALRRRSHARGHPAPRRRPEHRSPRAPHECRHRGRARHARCASRWKRRGSRRDRAEHADAVRRYAEGTRPGPSRCSRGTSSATSASPSPWSWPRVSTSSPTPSTR